MNYERLQLIQELDAVGRENIVGRGDTWPYDQYVHPHIFSVENHTLGPLLKPYDSLQQVVDQRRAEGKSTHVLELFGSGVVLAHPESADSITGVRLLDVTYPWTPPRPKHHSVFLYNLFGAGALPALADNLKRRHIPHIDIAICAPEGGWHSWERDYTPATLVGLFYPMLQNVYSLLSPDGGTLYSRIPDLRLTREELDAWGKRMNNSGINTRIVSGDRGPLLQITRNEHSPAELVPLMGRALPPPPRQPDRPHRLWRFLRRS